MNLATISLILGTVASFFAILAYMYKGIRFNKARSRAQQGRIVALLQVAKFQGKRLTSIETYLSKEDGNNYQMNHELIDLETEAMKEFKEHDTHLT